MRRFFITPPESPDRQEITLSKEESHHISKVLRLQPDVDVELYDGTGRLYQATILTVGKTVKMQIHSCEHFPPPQPTLILHAGLLKNKKMEFVIQKATELGVDEIHLFTSEHTDAKPVNHKRMTRYQKIIQVSCKQCERLYPTTIFSPTPLSQQLAEPIPYGSRYLFWERETQVDPSQIGIINIYHPIHIFIGPEGGFSNTEIAQLPPDISVLSLGPQILRSETAVIAGLTIIGFLAGRFKH